MEEKAGPSQGIMENEGPKEVNSKKPRKGKSVRSRFFRPKRRGQTLSSKLDEPHPTDTESAEGDSATGCGDGDHESSESSYFDDEQRWYSTDSQDESVSSCSESVMSVDSTECVSSVDTSELSKDRSQPSSQESREHFIADTAGPSKMSQPGIPITSDPQPTPTPRSSKLSPTPIITSDSNIIPAAEEINDPFPVPDIELIKRLHFMVDAVLYDSWKSVYDAKSIRLLQFAPTHFSIIQKEVIVNFDGTLDIAVHGKTLKDSIQKQVLEGIIEPMALTEENLNKFASRCVCIVRNMKQFQVCLGADHLESFPIWSTIPNSHIDNNPFSETAYVLTCRADDCQRMVPYGKNIMRCEACKKVIKILRQKQVFAEKEDVSSRTANKYLNLKQALEKIKKQQTELRKKDKLIIRLREKVKEASETEGLILEEGVSLDLNEILCGAKLSKIQELFLQQQLEAASKQDPRGHRWHPAMIRLALSIKMTSDSAYNTLRDSGFIKLPCNRTLYNYSHAIKPQEGISTGLIEMVQKDLKKLGGENYQQYFALLVDEMYISKNLVYRKSDGKLIGYSNLDEVDREISELERRLESAGESSAVGSSTASASKPVGPTLATKVLAFMVKGLCTNIKCVIATYPCAEMNRDMLYTRSWNVIAQLESAGIKVLCYVCDGNAVNRGFFNMHTPLTTGVDVVFDTINFCSPERRPLYFVSDVSHLLKTIRNCFHNSGREPNKSRCMQINGEYIEWKTIIRLYHTFKDRTFRKSYKLNPQNVFINSFSSMKVIFAAQVLSDTVANDIEKQNWPGTKETVIFLRMMNRFFDILNGAHSSQWIKNNKVLLKPYDSTDDPRFDWLKNDFLKDYLKAWKTKSENLGLPTPKEVEKTMLALQTLEGIEISVRSIIASITFLLNEGAKFVMARAFSQDPLEQHFSRQRSGFGGSTNPNASQVEQRVVGLAIQRSLRVRKRNANVSCEDEDEEETLAMLSEPMKKKPKS